MLVEGYEELSLALASGARPQTLFVCPELVRNTQDAIRIKEHLSNSTEVIEVNIPVFEKIAYRENPDGWLAVIPIVRRRLSDLTAVLNALRSRASSCHPLKALLVVAEAVEKPGNLGAILRSADAAGAHGLIVCDPVTDAYNPNVVRASKGTLFSVPVVEASTPEALPWLRGHAITIVAATPQAQTLYTDADLRGPVAIALGAEKEGLSRAWLEGADAVVRIPMLGRVNSLNVAMATALLLYEAVRQRQKAVE